MDESDLTQGNVDLLERIFDAGGSRYGAEPDDIVADGGIVTRSPGDGVFGLVIPSETGVFYEHQTGGMMCTQTRLQGTYVHLGTGGFVKNECEEKEDANESLANMSDELRRWNYVLTEDYWPGTLERWDSLDEIWSEIDKNLPFEYDEVNAPDGQPTRTEGIKWIHITGADDETWGFRGGENLVGETVALLYPNCD